MNYSDSSGGAVGENAAGILKDPEKSMRGPRNFKCIVENA